MKLTLRTMLAHLDNILEPAEAKEIEQKIAESEFATQLKNRVVEAVKSNALGAPAVSGSQMGIDPNRVAEYLDNVMPLDQVEEFEKLCLGTDAFLAELAACHQELTLILGEPAAVDPKVRERMYTLIDQADAKRKTKTGDSKTGDSKISKASASGISKKTADMVAAATSAPSQSAAPASAPAPSSSQSSVDKAPRQKPEVPEYLREESSSGWLMPVAVVAVLLAIAAVVWQMQNRNNVPVATTTPPAPERPLPTPPEDTTPTPPVDTPETPATAPTDTPEKTPETPTKAPTDTPEKTPETPAKAPTDTPEKTPETPTKAPTDTPEKTPETPTKLPTDIPPKTPETPTKAPTDTPEKTPEPTPPAVPDVPAVPKVQMGQFTSAESVLLFYNEEKTDWERLRPQSVVLSGVDYISLHTFRSRINLNAGITLDVLGGTRLKLVAPTAQGVPQVRVLFGQVVATSAKPGSQLILLIGDQKITTTFAGAAESRVGVEIRSRRPAGTDPENLEASPIEMLTSFYLNAGKANFDDGTTTLVVDKIPARGTLLPLKEVGAEDAKWITEDLTSPLDQRARPVLEKAIEPGTLATLRLRELADDPRKRPEVMLLALRSLGQIEVYEPLIRTLNIPDVRPTTRDAVMLQLIEAVHQGPETSAKLHTALKNVRETKAEDLWRLFWGFTKVQLDRGDAARLVGYLDHDDLDYRVISFWVLQDLTGVNMLYYPDQDKAARAAAISRWQQKLDKKEIVPRS